MNSFHDSADPQIEQAVALHYDGDSAPIVSARGQSALAREILKIAQTHHIPIYQNPQLVEQLVQLDIGEAIPELLYRIIAELLAFVYHLEGRTPEGQDTKEKEPL